MDQLSVLLVDDFFGLVDHWLAISIVDSLGLVVDQLAILLIENVFGFVDNWLASLIVHDFGRFALLVYYRFVLVVLFAGVSLVLGDLSCSWVLLVLNRLLGLLTTNSSLSKLSLSLLIAFHILICYDPLSVVFLLVLMMFIDHFRVPILNYLYLMVLNILVLQRLGLPLNLLRRLEVHLSVLCSALLHLLNILNLVACAILSFILHLFILLNSLSAFIVNSSLLIAHNFNVFNWSLLDYDLLALDGGLLVSSKVWSALER